MLGLIDVRLLCVLRLVGLEDERVSLVCYEPHAAGGSASILRPFYRWHVRRR